MKKHKTFVLIACLAASACSHSPESTTATEQIQLVEAVARLQANPWAGWRVGTRVTTHFANSTPQYPGVKHHAQSDLTYEVTGDGATFIRKQTVDGTVTTQRFEVANQVGVRGLGDLPGQSGIKTQLDFNGVSIECNEIRSTIEVFPGPIVTTTYWTVHKRPEVLLRRETSNSNYWQVVGFSTRMISGEEYRCVETRTRMATVFGFVVTTEHLNPSVPGHVVESVKEFHSVSSTAEKPILMMVERECTSLVDIPKPDSEQDKSSVRGKPRR
jgi:hypothetical protein